MFARAAALLLLLPGLGAADVPAAPVPGWLPEQATIRIPGETPIKVSFLAALERPRPPYPDYAATLEAARSGDGEASYSLYREGTICHLLRKRREREEPSLQPAGDANPERERLEAFCDTMPPDVWHLSSHWLRDAVEAGYPDAILEWGMRSPRAEGRERLEQLWYSGNLQALAVLADVERGWTRLSPESPRTLLVRSMGYEWLYVKVCEAAYQAAPEHQRRVAQLVRNFEQRWDALDQDEQRIALRLAHSLLLETTECCTVPVSGPQLIF